jgi:L-2-hydroxyglutarate oxidase LhgO
VDFDTIIIGAGIVGLACSAELAKTDRLVLVVERHSSFGQETSSRNSEVVHSGVYYPPGSLKARLCLIGNRTTYEDCERFDVWHNRCGKLIVAVDPEEEAELERLYERGRSNGVDGLELLDAEAVRRLEPNVRCHAAMLVPSSGVFDSHGLMRAYLMEAKSHGAEFTFGTTFERVADMANGYTIVLKEPNGEMTEVKARTIVNSSGLAADKVAKAFGIDIDAAGYRIHPNRGHYFRVSSSKAKLVSRLVYPCPRKDLTSLGIHVVIDRAGQTKFGPDAQYIDPSVPESQWYVFDESRKEQFHESIRRYLPAIEGEDLFPDQVGVRPKLQAPGGGVRDFVIAEESSRGLSGFLNLIGIESPGLTCAREIAKEVVSIVTT